MPTDERIREGDHVLVNGGAVHWVVTKIDSRLDPLGVVLHSGQTGRTRRETLANLRVYMKGVTG